MNKEFKKDCDEFLTKQFMNEPKPQTPLADAFSKSRKWEHCEEWDDFARSLEIKLQEAEASRARLQKAVMNGQRINDALDRAEEAERQRGDAIKQIQVTGAWQCDKCGFQLVKSILHTRDGSISANKEPFAEQCPNDGTFMRPCTWKEYSESNYQSAVKAMIERDKLIKVVDEAVEFSNPRATKGLEYAEMLAAYSLLPHVLAKKNENSTKV